MGSFLEGNLSAGRPAPPSERVDYDRAARGSQGSWPAPLGRFGETRVNGAMTSLLSRRALLGTLFAIAAAAPSLVRAQALEKFKTAKLTIVSAGKRNDFTIELALTDSQQQQGLMFRRTMAPDAGMMFDYRTPTRITMWMKNTLIPLDMIFIGADGKVVHIAERAVPMSEEIIPSEVPARAVLEVNGGTAQRLGIKVGDAVESDALGKL